jgi:DNA-binding CsgD family transcriptional regulator
MSGGRKLGPQSR